MSACSFHDRDGEQCQHGALGQHPEQGLGGLEAALAPTGGVALCEAVAA
ncbi:MAG: hypothetical protein ACRDRL_17670 [Sciscionella sp.]